MFLKSDRVHERHVVADRVPADPFLYALRGHVAVTLEKVGVGVFLEMDHMHVSISEGAQDIAQAPAELIGWGRVAEVFDALGILEVRLKFAVGSRSQGDIVAHTVLNDWGSRAGVWVCLDLLLVEHVANRVELDQAEPSAWFEDLVDSFCPCLSYVQEFNQVRNSVFLREEGEIPGEKILGQLMFKHCYSTFMLDSQFTAP